MLVLPVVVLAVVAVPGRGLRLRLDDRVHLARRLVEQRVVGARRRHVDDGVRGFTHGRLLHGQLDGRAGRGRAHLRLLLLALSLLDLAPLRLRVDELVRRTLTIASPISIRTARQTKRTALNRQRDANQSLESVNKGKRSFYDEASLHGNKRDNFRAQEDPERPFRGLAVCAKESVSSLFLSSSPLCKLEIPQVKCDGGRLNRFTTPASVSGHSRSESHQSGNRKKMSDLRQRSPFK